MKAKYLGILLLMIVAACAKPDKKAQLVELQKQYDEISDKIKSLEDEIKKESGDTLKIKGNRVAINEISKATFIHCIEVQGKVDGDESVNVFSEGAGGIIDKIYVKEGQYVTKGQVLASMDDQVLQASLKSILPNLELATTMYNKQKALWEQKIGSEVQYLSAKTQKESLENNVATIKEQIDMCKIKAPISGSVEDIQIKIGQLVGPGIITFRVVNLSALKITAELAEGYSSRVNQGDNVTVTLPDLKKELNGKVDFSSRFINPVNRTFSINVRIPSTDKAIKANMVAILKIVDYRSDNAITVPINVVQNDQEGTFVFIVDKKGEQPIAKKAKVTTGETYKGMVEIKEGLKIGDKLITVGYLELENGQPIQF